MSAAPEDLGAEREIDLRAWWNALLARRWFIVAGFVGGIVVGALYSLSGGSAFTATSYIAPGQAFNPSGSTAVLTYLTSQTAINTIATSNTTLTAAAAQAGMGVGELRGHVSTFAVNQGTGTPSATRNAVLVGITVQLGKRKRAEDVANAIARIVQQRTTSPYVKESISIIANRLKGYAQRLTTLKQRITFLDKALTQPGLTLDASLLLAIQLDQAQATYGQTQDAQLTAQQQQSLSEQVEQTQIIQQAVAEKTTARSRRNSVLFGALIGLLLGAIVATFVGLRSKPAPAAA